MAPPDAATLIDANFEDAVVLDHELFRGTHRELANRGIAGGAVYDALVGLAARSHELLLATRDARARTTYEAIGARVEFLV